MFSRSVTADEFFTKTCGDLGEVSLSDFTQTFLSLMSQPFRQMEKGPDDF